MLSPFVIPLAAFAFVALIVAITEMAKIRDAETNVAQQIQIAEFDHKHKMQELENELARVKQSS